MKKHIIRSLLVCAALLLLASVAAEAQLINGGFETGDFTGWTIFDDTNGTTGDATVVLFDVAGTGMPSLCAQFEVGSTVPYVYGSAGSGGGISQLVNLNSGQLNIALNVAVYNPLPLKNGEAGTFILSLDGKNVASDVFGPINGYQTNRSTLGCTTTVGGGTHEIAIDMTRIYEMGTGSSASPYQYLDDIVLSGAAVPGPIPLNIQLSDSTVIITWTNSAYTLQAAPSPIGAYTNVAGATSPYTNIISGSAQYFRLIIY
ncbi:MAG: hypothetical protein ABSG59_04790 [Verrucomicrobiota bacterium]|jgi:hypothetical protein